MPYPLRTIPWQRYSPRKNGNGLACKHTASHSALQTPADLYDLALQRHEGAYF